MPIDLKLEAIVIPVSDVDRAKKFYAGLGWRLDADFPFDNGFRVVQFTPPGSECSIQFGTKVTNAAPGSAKGLYLIVSDIAAAHDELVALGAGFQAGAGISIPTGETVPNPIELGREGLTHEHIQFGSGTVDPVVSALWSGSFGWLGAVAAADGQFPLYENSHGFHAPTTVRWAAGPTATVGTTGLSVQYAGQYQSIGRWNGEIDEGTGFVKGGIFFRASFLPWPRFRVAPSVYFELYSKSLSDQAFRQNTTFALTLTRFF